MLDLWIWMIEKLNLFKGFSEKEILRSFDLPIAFTFIILCVVFISLGIHFLKDEVDSFAILWISILIGSFLTMLICLFTMPSDPTTLIKTDLVKETTTTLIPSEGVTETSLVLKESGEKVQPSTLKDGDELTLIVKVGENDFKKDFQYKKENLKIKKGDKDEISSGYIRKREFQDTIFNQTRTREENDVVLEMSTTDPFFVNE